MAEPCIVFSALHSASISLRMCVIWPEATEQPQAKPHAQRHCTHWEIAVGMQATEGSRISPAAAAVIARNKGNPSAPALAPGVHLTQSLHQAFYSILSLTVDCTVSRASLSVMKAAQFLYVAWPRWLL